MIRACNLITKQKPLTQQTIVLFYFSNVSALMGHHQAHFRENTRGCMTLKELVTYFKLFDVVHAQLKV